MARPELMRTEELSLETLIGVAEMLAAEESDGHLTLMRFTTGWKVFLQTPDLDSGAGREDVFNIQMHGTLKDGLVALLLNKQRAKNK